MTTALAGGIRRPGIYTGISAERYRNDPVVRPSLNHSTLRVLLDRSPMHARAIHPRISPNFKPSQPTSAMIAGTVLHTLILGKGEAVQIIDADSYRTNAAKEERDSAFAKGVIPILRDEYEELKVCADAVIAQLRDDPEAATFFAPGRSEAIAIWRTGPVWCRAMIDRLPDAPGAPLWDIKSTGMSARPEDWERALAKRYATQAAFYRLGASTALKRPVGDMFFVVFERTYPYATAIVGLGETLMEVAEAEVLKGIKAWATCLVTDEWPGYGKGVHRIEADLRLMMRTEAARAELARIAE